MPCTADGTIAYHAASASVAAARPGGTAVTIWHQDQEQLLRGIPPIAWIRWAPVEQLLLLIAGEAGTIVLLTQLRDGEPLECVARFEPLGVAICALEWLTAASGFGGRSAASVPLGFEAFVAVGANGALALHWRRRFGASPYSTNFAAGTISDGNVGAELFGWSCVRSVLPLSAEAPVGLASLCAVPTAGKRGALLLATAGSSPSREVTLWRVQLPQLTGPHGREIAAGDGISTTRLALLSAGADLSQLVLLSQVQYDSNHKQTPQEPCLLMLTSQPAADGEMGGATGEAAASGGKRGGGRRGKAASVKAEPGERAGGEATGAELWRTSVPIESDDLVAGVWERAWQAAPRGSPAAALGLSCNADSSEALVCHADGTLSLLDLTAAASKEQPAPHERFAEVQLVPLPISDSVTDGREEGGVEPRPKRSRQEAPLPFHLSPNGTIAASVESATCKPLREVDVTDGAIREEDGSSAPRLRLHALVRESGVEDTEGIYALVQRGSRRLCARMNASPSDPRPPTTTWDVLASLPRKLVMKATRAMAEQVEMRLESLWQAVASEEARAEASRAEAAKVETEKADALLEEAAMAVAARARAAAELNLEGPRACALLSALWAAAAEACRTTAEPASGMDAEPRLADGSGLATAWKLASAWRSHAALWLSCEVVGEELDRWGAAYQESTSIAGLELNLLSSPPANSRPRSDSQPGATKPDGGEGNESVGGGAAGGTEESGSSTGGLSRWEVRWDEEVMAHLVGSARLCTMSERRLAELHEPCHQLIMLLLAWMDITRQPHQHAQNTDGDGDAGAGDGGGGDSGGSGQQGTGNARTMRLLARPPPMVDALLPRVTAVLLAAHTRLGHVCEGAGGGALVGQCSMETLKLIFSAYRLRSSHRGGGLGSLGSARSGGLGSEVAWGVASICEQYGLGSGQRIRCAYSPHALLQRPVALRAFEELMGWAAAEELCRARH